MTPHIYVLILNWNGKSVLQDCIETVLSVDYPNYNILVVTDGLANLVWG